MELSTLAILMTTGRDSTTTMQESLDLLAEKREEMAPYCYMLVVGGGVR